MFHKILLIIIFCIFFTTTSLAAPKETNMEYIAPIILQGDNPYKTVNLDYNILTKRSANASSLRVLESGKEIPYLLYDQNTKTHLANTSFATKKSDFFSKNGDDFVDFKITKEANQDVYGNALSLTILNTNFAKNITVLGSSDSNNWTYLTESLVYHVDNKQNYTIPLLDTCKYEYYRFKIPNNKEAISITKVNLTYTEEAEKIRTFSDGFRPTFSVKSENKKTLITIPFDEVKNLKLFSAELETDSLFERNVSVLNNTDTLYNLTFQNLSIQKLLMNLNEFTSSSDLIIVIDDGNDPPIHVKGITLRYNTSNIIFKSQPNESYAITFGKENAASPQYDVTAYSNYMLQEGVSFCHYGTIEPLSVKKQFAMVQAGWILNVVVCLCAIVLIGFIIAAIKKK